MFLAALFSESNIESTRREMIPGNQGFEPPECASGWFNRENAAFGSYLGRSEGSVVTDIGAHVDYGHAGGEKAGDKPGFNWLKSAEIYRALDPVGKIKFEL